MDDDKTPRQTLIAHTVDRLVENRENAAEALGMSQIGVRYLDPDDTDGDALHIHEPSRRPPRTARPTAA